MAGPTTHPFTAADRRAGYRYASPSSKPSYLHPGARPSPGRKGLLRGGHPIQSRHRKTDQVSLTFDRRITGRTRDASAPASSPTESSPPSTPTTSTRESSSTGNKESPFEPRPPSTTQRLRYRQTAAQPARLREIGFSANRRLLEVQRISGDRSPEPTPTKRSASPSSSTAAGARLRFDQPATQALLTVLVVCRMRPNGFANRQLRELLAPRWACPPAP